MSSFGRPQSDTLRGALSKFENHCPIESDDVMTPWVNGSIILGPTTFTPQDEWTEHWLLPLIVHSDVKNLPSDGDCSTELQGRYKSFL